MLTKESTSVSVVVVDIHPIFFSFINYMLSTLYINEDLQNILPQLMEDVPLHVRMNMWMQHDGAPSD